MTTQKTFDDAWREQRRLEVAVLRLNVELYEHQTDILKGRVPRPVEVDPGARLREAVRKLADWHGSIVHLEADLDQEAYEYDNDSTVLVPEAPLRMQWITRTMNDVRTGDRIRFRGAKAVVETAYCRHWHVHPASKYIPLEHGDVALRLVGRTKLFVLKLDLEVDIHLTEDEVTALDAMGWDSRVCVITETMHSQLTGIRS